MMASRRFSGIPGTAVLAGTAGLYLVYVGVKDVPFFEGLKHILKGERPPSNPSTSNIVSTSPAGVNTGADTGIDKLVGYAKAAYPRFKGFGLTIGGWRSVGSVPNSDHPKGKALDIMHPSPEQAAAIIFMFKGMPGAKQWIWNNNTAFRTSEWKVKTYLGPNPHTDHVHLSFE